MTEHRPGYLAEIEASHITTKAMPGAIVVLLERNIASERRAGRRPRKMMIELSMSEAYQHWTALGDTLRKAGALASQPGHVDAATNL